MRKYHHTNAENRLKWASIDSAFDNSPDSKPIPLHEMFPTCKPPPSIDNVKTPEKSSAKDLKIRKFIVRKDFFETFYNPPKVDPHEAISEKIPGKNNEIEENRPREDFGNTYYVSPKVDLNAKTLGKREKSSAKDYKIRKFSVGKDFFETFYSQPQKIDPSLNLLGPKKPSSQADLYKKYMVYGLSSGSPPKNSWLCLRLRKVKPVNDIYFCLSDLEQQEKSDHFSDPIGKKADLQEEFAIDKPISATISIKGLAMKDLLKQLDTETDVEGQDTVTMQNLHDYLELILAMSQFMKANCDTFFLIKKSTEEVPKIIELMKGIPKKDSIMKICNWVHLSRCYTENLKELIKVSDLEGTNPPSEKPFDEVRLKYTINFLITYVRSFEYLFASNKEKVTQEVPVKDKDDILSVSRQIDWICQCISEDLVNYFKRNKNRLVAECKELLAGFMYSYQQVQADYLKIRECVEEKLETFKVLYYKIANVGKNGYLETEKRVKNNLEAVPKMAIELNQRFPYLVPLEANASLFSGSVTEAETMKMVISFKLTVGNINTHTQRLSQIRKKLSGYKELMNQYFHKGTTFIPTDAQVAEIYKEMIRIPPIKAAVTEFVSYFEKQVRIQFSDEVFSEILTQLKAAAENFHKLCFFVDKRFQDFLQSYFTTLVELVEKSKHSINEGLIQTLQWSNSADHLDIEAFIARILHSVSEGEDSLKKIEFLKKYNYKDAIETEDPRVIEERMNAWNGEVEYVDHLIKYFEYISSELVKPMVKLNTEYDKSNAVEFTFTEFFQGYIDLRGRRKFLDICKPISDGIDMRQPEKSEKAQVLLRNFEGSVLGYLLRELIESFCKKSQVKFEKYFTNLDGQMDPEVLENFKRFVLEWIDFLETPSNDNKLLGKLQGFFASSQPRIEELGDVAYLLEQLILISTNQPCILTNEDEDRIIPKTAPISAKLSFFKFLVESIHHFREKAIHNQ